jgi:tetratricopeptide (TPR) repeat protein
MQMPDNVRKLTRSLLAGLAAALLALLFLVPAAMAQSTLPENAQQSIQRGEQLMQEALATYDAQYPDRPLWQQAFREGRNAVALAPGNPAPLRFLAEAYSRATWPGPAVRTWNQFLAAGGVLDDEAKQLYLADANGIAYEAYAQGDLERAAELYLEVTRVVPGDVEAHRWLGRILLELGLPDQAVAAWQTVTELDPSDNGAAYFLDLSRAQARWGIEAANAFYAGVAAYEAGDMAQARNSFATATARNADYAEAWAWLGRVAFEGGNYQDAYSAYSRAATLQPTNDTYSWFRKESQRLAGGN